MKKRYGWAAVLDHVEPGKSEMSVKSVQRVGLGN